jgi:hypothetical protein
VPTAGRGGFDEARVSGGRLDLANALQQTGSAWSTTKIDVARSFTTSFAATISKPTDGVALVIQSQGPTAIGTYGGGIGYGARPGDGGPAIRPSIAVELDTWDNSVDGFDPAGHQHIAVTPNGDVANNLVWRDPGFSMYANQPTYV